MNFSRNLAAGLRAVGRGFGALGSFFTELMSNFLFAGLLSTRRHEIVERVRTVSNALGGFMQKCYAEASRRLFYI